MGTLFAISNCSDRAESSQGLTSACQFILDRNQNFFCLTGIYNKTLQNLAVSKTGKFFPFEFGCDIIGVRRAQPKTPECLYMGSQASKVLAMDGSWALRASVGRYLKDTMGITERAMKYSQ